MTPENRTIPDWAQRERHADLGWIAENLDVFWTVATTALEDAGRGAVVVDTTLQPVPGAAPPSLPDAAYPPDVVYPLDAVYPPSLRNSGK